MREKLRRPGIAVFYTALLLILFVDYVSATSVSLTYSGRLFQLAAVLLMFKVFVTKYTKTEYILLGLSLIIAALSFLYVHNYFACLLFLLIFAGKDIPFKKIVSLYLIFVGACIVITASTAFLGICGEISMKQDFRGLGIETRYCFGFTHPNTCHIINLQFILVLIWFFWEKVEWFHIVTAILINIFIYIFTDSRTNMLLGTVVLGIMLIGKIWKWIQKAEWVYGLGIITLTASLLLSFLTVIYDTTESALLNFVDKVWTSRIYWGHIWAKYYLTYEDNTVTGWTEREKVTLFSHRDGQILIDMGFLKLYYNYGIIIFTIVIALMLIKIYRNARKKDLAELMIIVSGMVWMLGESFSFGQYITRNILFVFMLDLLQKQEVSYGSINGGINIRTVEET